MSAIRFRTRFGPDYTRGGARKGGFTSTKNAATAIFEEAVHSTMRKATEKGREEVVKNLPKVQADIERDLEKFVNQAFRFMFRQTSSPRGAPLRIAVGDIGQGIFVSGYENKILDRNRPVLWPALSKRTLHQKAPITTYFIKTGEFKEELAGVFPAFIQTVLKPSIKFDEVEETDPILKRTQTIGRVSVFVAASKKGQNLSNMPFLATGTVTAGADRSLISRYMSEVLANKLTNARHPDKQRVIVSPLLAHWVLNRFPNVVQSSVRKHFKLKAVDNGGIGP